MKIAIIGSGIAGLSSALFLSKKHDVTIFEKDNRVGGHSNTVFVKEKGQQIPVDTGFMVFNPEMYPNLVKLFNYLEVETIDTRMSFGVSIKDQVSFSGSSINGLFSEREKIFSIRYIKFLFGILRFMKLARKSLDKNSSNISLGEFVSKHKINEDVLNWFLYPMLSAIWSVNRKTLIRDFPASSTFTFMNNHKLLELGKLHWKTVKSGSIEYVSRLTKILKRQGVDIKTNQKIENIIRKSNKIIINTENKTYKYDFVIMATHADVTRELITELSQKEVAALSMFEYTKNKVVLHKDTSFLPENKRTVSAWNYIEPVAGETSSAEFTYCMNILQSIDSTYPMLVTLNPKKEIDRSKVYSIHSYDHPIYSTKTLNGVKLITEIQGENRTYYAGAHLGYGFHEDGIVSAINVVKHFGISNPWNHE